MAATTPAVPGGVCCTQNQRWGQYMTRAQRGIRRLHAVSEPSSSLSVRSALVASCHEVTARLGRRRRPFCCRRPRLGPSSAGAVSHVTLDGLTSRRRTPMPRRLPRRRFRVALVVRECFLQLNGRARSAVHMHCPETESPTRKLGIFSVDKSSSTVLTNAAGR